MSTPVKVTVTGAAGQIGYALLFRIASGQMLGADTAGRAAAARDPRRGQGRRGHRDGARRLRLPAARRRSTSPTTRSGAFDGANVALLVGARPRGPGMERADLLEANGGIFKPQGEAINAGAADDVKVLVVGNPANTNCLIAMSQRARRPARALHRDDAPRPQPRDRPARRTSSAPPVTDDHQHDDLGQPLDRPSTPTSSTPRSTGKPAWDAVDDEAWIADEFIPTVAKRGAAIIEARGASSAASAANAAIDHVHDWVLGTPDGDWVSMGVPSDGSYGVAEGIISRLPVHLRGRRVDDRPGPRDRRLLPRADRRVASPSCSEERDAVEQLGLI